MALCIKEVGKIPMVDKSAWMSATILLWLWQKTANFLQTDARGSYTGALILRVGEK